MKFEIACRGIASVCYHVRKRICGHNKFLLVEEFEIYFFSDFSNKDEFVEGSLW